MTTSAEPVPVDGAPPPRSSSARGLVESLLGLPLWIAFAAGFAALIKVMTVANYSLTTTLVIITTSPRDVLLGAVTANAYLMIGMAAFGVLYTGIKIGAFRHGSPIGTTLTVLAFVSCSLEIPWRYWFAGLGLFVLTGALTVSGRLTTVRTRQVGVQVLAAAIGVTLVGFVQPTVRQPWLPAEYLVLDQRVVVAQKTSADPTHPVMSSAFVGYVISSAPDGWTTVLTAQHRFIIRVPSSQIRSRYICKIEGYSLNGERSIYQFLRGQVYDSPNEDCDVVAARVGSAIPENER